MIYYVSLSNTNKMDEKVSYQFYVEKKLWKRFKACLRKVYWEEGKAINVWLTDSIEEFVKENDFHKNDSQNSLKNAKRNI